MKKRSAFTLIEMLVVLAIISILAAFIFPAFARARESARQTSCASNLQQLGLAIAMYRDDYDNVFPVGYYYTPNGTNDDGTGYRYTHWSWLVQPYLKDAQTFVCPSDTGDGTSPYNCDTFAHAWCNTKQLYGDTQTPALEGGSKGITDHQMLRLSYTANEQILGRKRSPGTPVNAVKESVISSPTTVILLAEASGGFNDNGLPDGQSTHSYRTSSVLTQDQLGGQYESEHGSSLPICAISPATYARLLSGDLKLEPPLPSHIVHLAPKQHKEGANYAFLDGHVKWMHINQTLDPNEFLWGTHVYSQANKTVYREDGTTPVR